jgi:hypothetical protein
MPKLRKYELAWLIATMTSQSLMEMLIDLEISMYRDEWVMDN